MHRPIIRSDATYERIIIYVSPEYLESFSDTDGDLGFCLKQAAKEQSHVLRLHGSKAAKLASAIKALHNGLAFIENSPSDEKIIAVLNYLSEHLTEDISIDDLSARFFLSRYYLMHTFKEQTGYTIGGYLSTKRLLLAKELIAEGTPITEVCYACGFKNYSTFSRAYKKSFGESPRDFLQSLKN